MKTNIDWNKFKLFYYIAKAGSFTATAERLNISQPSLSRSIQALEYQLGTKLFERVSHGIVLTKQGQYLFQAAEKAFEEFSKAEMLMKEEERELQGVLKVGMPNNLAPGWLISHIGEFLKKYPNIQLSIITNNEEIDLKMGQVDIALRSFMDKSSDVIQDLIHIFYVKLYASQSYLEQYGLPKRTKDLQDHKLIVYGFDTPAPYTNINWPLTFGLPKKSTRSSYMCLSSLAEMAQAAEDGHGIVALPMEYLGVVDKTLMEVLPDIKKPTIPLYYAYPRHLKESQKIKVLAKYLKDKFSSESNLSDDVGQKIVNL